MVTSIALSYVTSPHFVNSLYLDSPERIEALTYLILISLRYYMLLNML